MSNDSDIHLVPTPGEAVGWECAQPPRQSNEGGFEKHSEGSFTAVGTLSGYDLRAACSAYDLSSRILNCPKGGVEALIELAGGAETHWLEFKAACHPTPEFPLDPGEDEGDLKWNIAKACVALANTDGGCLLLGVDDAGNAVGLGASDPKGRIAGKGMDNFIRHLDDSLFRPIKGWQGQKSGTVAIDGGVPLDLFEYRVCTLQDRQVLAVLVSPVPQGQPCLHCIETKNNRPRSMLLVRKLGMIGRVEELLMPREITAWENGRQPAKPDYATRLQNFEDSLQAALEPPGLENRIAAYHAHLADKLREVERGFTSLDAEERTDLDIGPEAYQPWAEEQLAPDFDWEDAVGGNACSERHGSEQDDNFSSDEDHESPDEGEEETDEQEEGDERQEDTRIARRGGVFDLLDQERRGILLGDPGAGKTTCLQRLALRAAATYTTEGRVPVFAPLSRYQRPTDLMPLLIRSTIFQSASLKETDLLWLIRSGRLLLLLDAFNECPDSLRGECGTEIENLLLDHPDLAIVLSARSIGWSERVRLPAFTLQPMNQAQRDEFLRKCLGDESQAIGLIQHLRDWGEERMDLGNPMLLRMAAKVFRKDGSLPSGQALLYRRIVAIWYTREIKKATDAGQRLPWDSATVMAALAALAFEGRARGLRILHRDAALQVLGSSLANPEDFLATLGQGFLLRSTEAGVEFGHESYQEYFTAEHILNHPAQLVDRRLDKTTWGMVLVYAAQLGPLPPALADASWRIDPWLGAALDTRDAIPCFVKEITNRWSREDLAVLKFIAEDADVDGPIPRPTKYAQNTYSPADSALRAAVFSLPRARRRWEAHEAKLLRNGVNLNKAVVWLPRLLLPPSSLSRGKIVRLWIAQASAEQATSLVKSGICTVRDFEPRRPEWITKASTEQAASWVKQGLWGFTAKDFEGRKPEWIAKASAEQAISWIKQGLWGFTAKDFEGRKPEWIAKASAEQAISWIKQGLWGFTAQDFEGRKPEWIANAPAEQAASWVKSGALGFTAQDFEIRKSGWIAEAPPEQAASLIKSGIFQLSDFDPRRPEWIANASVEQAAGLVQSGICTAEDFESRKPEWIANASVEQAASWVSSGILGFTSQDFEPRKSGWIAEALPEQAASLVKSGICMIQDFDPRRPEWIANAPAEQAASWVKSGALGFTSQDFEIRKSGWIAEAPPEQAASLVKSGICTIQDFDPRRPEWVTSASVEQVANLVSAGICTAQDFKSRKQEWIEKGLLLMCKKCGGSGTWQRIGTCRRCGGTGEKIGRNGYRVGNCYGCDGSGEPPILECIACRGTGCWMKSRKSAEQVDLLMPTQEASAIRDSRRYSRKHNSPSLHPDLSNSKADFTSYARFRPPNIESGTFDGVSSAVTMIMILLKKSVRNIFKRLP